MSLIIGTSGPEDEEIALESAPGWGRKRSNEAEIATDLNFWERGSARSWFARVLGKPLEIGVNKFRSATLSKSTTSSTQRSCYFAVLFRFLAGLTETVRLHEWFLVLKTIGDRAEWPQVRLWDPWDRYIHVWTDVYRISSWATFCLFLPHLRFDRGNKVHSASCLQADKCSWKFWNLSSLRISSFEEVDRC